LDSKIIILLLLLVSACSITGSTVYNPDGPFKVTKVVDGDTLDLSNGDRIRLMGINTPEKDDCYYQEAKDELTDLTLNQIVLLEKDNTDQDKYGRKLRFVYVKGTDVNAHLVEHGFARAFDEFPSSNYKDLKALESRAKESNLGMWSC